MENSRTEVIGGDSKTIQRGIPSARARRSRAFMSLSTRLNTLKGEYAIAHESLDILVYALDAQAGLIAIFRPVDVLYSKYRTDSENLLRLESEIGKGRDAIAGTIPETRSAASTTAAGLVIVPLRWGADIVGLFAFDVRRRRLTPHEQSSVTFLANHVSALLGLRNSGTGNPSTLPFVHKDLERAAAMQKSLLPSMPQHGCGLAIAADTHAADFVGGDYFDLVLLDQNRIGIVIADVEGKGVSAALFGSMLRSTVHFLTRESPSTAAVMGKLNAILHKDVVSSQKLFSMFYGVYDAKEKRLTFSGSGHVCPIVLRAATHSCERLHSDGTLVGVSQQQRFVERSVQLAQDDVIVFFTDGLTDHADAQGEPFGDDRLIEILCEHGAKTSEEIIGHIKERLATFSPLPAQDDATILVTKIL